MSYMVTKYGSYCVDDALALLQFIGLNGEKSHHDAQSAVIRVLGSDDLLHVKLENQKRFDPYRSVSRWTPSLQLFSENADVIRRISKALGEPSYKDNHGKMRLDRSASCVDSFTLSRERRNFLENALLILIAASADDSGENEDRSVARNTQNTCQALRKCLDMMSACTKFRKNRSLMMTYPDLSTRDQRKTRFSAYLVYHTSKEPDQAALPLANGLLRVFSSDEALRAEMISNHAISVVQQNGEKLSKTSILLNVSSDYRVKDFLLHGDISCLSKDCMGVIELEEALPGSPMADFLSHVRKTIEKDFALSDIIEKEFVLSDIRPLIDGVSVGLARKMNPDGYVSVISGLDWNAKESPIDSRCGQVILIPQAMLLNNRGDDGDDIPVDIISHALNEIPYQVIVDRDVTGVVENDSIRVFEKTLPYPVCDAKSNDVADTPTVDITFSVRETPVAKRKSAGETIAAGYIPVTIRGEKAMRAAVMNALAEKLDAITLEDWAENPVPLSGD